MTTKQTIRTEQYEFSHGRKPRGYGHWAFEPRNVTVRRQPGATLESIVFIRGFMTYSAAKHRLNEICIDRNWSGEWQVCP